MSSIDKEMEQNPNESRELVRAFGCIDDCYWIDADGRITNPPLARRKGFSLISHFAGHALESVFFAIGGRWIAAQKIIEHRSDGHFCFDRSVHDFAHCPAAARQELGGLRTSGMRESGYAVEPTP
jgi:hypothetical protein